jgi:hypothetical protein
VTKAQLGAWGFDGCKRRAGCDHAVRAGEDRTLCGRHINPRGYPTGEPFRPEESYSCKVCRRVSESGGAA